MTTIALDIELAGQLRRSAGEGSFWCRKAKAMLVGGALSEVKERMRLRSFVRLFPEGEVLEEKVARLAFQSVEGDDQESVCIAIGVYVYYLVLEGMVPAVEFDTVFSRAWKVYFDSVQEWIRIGIETIEGALI